MRGGWGRGRLAILAGALLLAATGAAQAQERRPGESKTFRDWFAGCDNIKSCTAISLPDDAAEDVGFLKLQRPAGPDGAVSLSLTLTGNKLKAPLTIALALDGAPYGSPSAAKIADPETARLVFSPADADALLNAMRKATKLTAAMAGTTYNISLAGSVAALLWIDERQGRLNTVSALIRKGPAAASTVPRPPALPVITARASAPQFDEAKAKALGAALRKRLEIIDPKACTTDDGSPRDADQAWPLAGGYTLIGIPCGSGAYNVSTGYWMITGDAMTSAHRVIFGRDNDNTLINSGYAPNAGEMTYFAKGRGVGDCGSSGSYAWTGSDFVLSSLRSMDACRQLPPDEWLTLYRSEVKVVK